MHITYIIYFIISIIVLSIVSKVYFSLRTIHIIHRIDHSNTGDMVSSCSNYFFFPKIVKHDIYKVDLKKIKKSDYVIFSGGGLFDNNDGWNETINKVLSISNNCYAWGVGLNLHTNNKIQTHILFDKFKKIGLRDYQNKYDISYLPCSSCMISCLKNKYNIVRKYGVLEHIHHKIPLNLPKLKNSKNIEDIIRFIGETECVITNTYHCYYFSMLMKKKVLLFEKFSSKFDTLRYDPLMYTGNLKADFDKCIIYPNFHNECINLNKLFYNSFMKDYIISCIKFM